jgi:hypothetical protein
MHTDDWVWWCTPAIPATQQAEVGGWPLAKNKTRYVKLKTKRTESVAHVVECCIASARPRV